MNMLVRIAIILGFGAIGVGAQLILADFAVHPASVAVHRKPLPTAPPNYRCVKDGRCLQVPDGTAEVVFSDDDVETIVVPRQPALARR